MDDSTIALIVVASIAGIFFAVIAIGAFLTSATYIFGPPLAFILGAPFLGVALGVAIALAIPCLILWGILTGPFWIWVECKHIEAREGLKIIGERLWMIIKPIGWVISFLITSCVEVIANTIANTIAKVKLWRKK